MTPLANVQENYIVWLLAGSRSQRWGYEEVLEVRQLLLRIGGARGPMCVCGGWLCGGERKLHMMLVMVTDNDYLMTGVVMMVVMVMLLVMGL